MRLKTSQPFELVKVHDLKCEILYWNPTETE